MTLRAYMARRERWRRAWVADGIPVGERGIWSIDRIQTEDGLQAWRHEMEGRPVEVGATYTRLSRQVNGTEPVRKVTVMSDTPAELDDHRVLFDRVEQMQAKRVVINGLGLGCALRVILASPYIERVDVVEYSHDVLYLVGPTFDDPRLHLHQGDSYTYLWPRGSRWDIAWHDIWDTISSSNIPLMRQLKNRFRHRVKWQGCWSEEIARDM